MPHIHEKIDYTVEVFIVHKNRVLLRRHDKYKIWLSVGGHVELDEDPNEAAVREAREEVGLDITLYEGNRHFKYETVGNRQLIPPIALGRHNITPEHEHVTLIYFASSNSDAVVPEKPGDVWKWVDREEMEAMEINPDVQYYARMALETLS